MNPNIIPQLMTIFLVSMAVALGAIILLAVDVQRGLPIFRNLPKNERPKSAISAWALSIIAAVAGPQMPAAASIAIVVGVLQWRRANKSAQPQVALAKLAILNGSFLLAAGIAFLAWAL